MVQQIQLWQIRGRNLWVIFLNGYADYLNTTAYHPENNGALERTH